MNDPRVHSQQVQPVIVYRREPVRDEAAWPMPTVLSAPPAAELAPLPIPYTASYGEGRDKDHAPTPHRTPLQLAIPEWTTIVAPHPVAPRIVTPKYIATPYGNMNPIRERTNIDRPPAQALGDKLAIQQQNYSTGAGKLLFQL